GVGHALPAVPLGGTGAAAGVLEVIAGVGAHQHRQGVLGVGGRVGQPGPVGEGEAHRLHRRRVDAVEVVQPRDLVPVVHAGADPALEVVALIIGGGGHHMVHGAEGFDEGVVQLGGLLAGGGGAGGHPAD